MFTGLIEEIGTVKNISKGSKSAQITINADKVLEDIKLGDSISTNGVCLTVIKYDKNSFTIDVMPETINKSNLKFINIGSKVNLERALRLGDRLGGHLVSGHVDGTGLINNITEDDNATIVTIKAPNDVLKYVVQKGSIAIDGTSLTVVSVDKETFKVSIIPLTKDETTLLSKKVGEVVNLECDMIGKYVEKLLSFENKNDRKSSIDMNFLKENGFL